MKRVFNSTMAHNHNRIGREISTAALLPLARRGISTRSQNLQNISLDQNVDPSKIITNKRKADASPLKNNKTTKIKRSALGNLTNAVFDDDKKFVKKTVKTKKIDETQKKTVLQSNTNHNAILTNNNIAITSFLNNNNDVKVTTTNLLPPPNPRGTKILTRAAAKCNAVITNPPSTIDTSKNKEQTEQLVETATKSKEGIPVPKPTTRRISNEFQSDDSLYMSALEEIPENNSNKPKISPLPTTSLQLTSTKHIKKVLAESGNKKKEKKQDVEDIKIETLNLSSFEVPSNVDDFDKENWDDPNQVSHYAMDIFNYLKEREEVYPITDYMGKQPCLTRWMRSLLIDWMVEVQESFELNHETLYLGVKIVDLYLGKETITKDTLQLLGAAALFIASKFDERIPPLITDFLYICDGAYKEKQLILMEMNVVKTIGFCLGIPLSYRFLRRYARCAKVSMPILTLARFILEFSLMDYGTIQFRDSKMAAATLFMALRMNNLPGWNDTLTYYTGYNLEEFADIVLVLNTGLARKPKEALSTIRNKYSHSVFLEVANIPVKSNSELFENIVTGNVENKILP